MKLMGHWKSAEGAQEIAEVVARFPSLTPEYIADKCHAALRGIIQIIPGVGYTITLTLPPKYPKDVPMLYCDPVEIPISGDRHFFTNTGAACLCATSEYRIHWPHGSRLVAFVDKLVVPFLTSQFYFQTHGNWPPTGQRAHGPKGIVAAYAEIALPLGNTNLSTIRNLMVYLARKGEPKGHEVCPCGSNLPLRKCHVATVRQLRNQIQREHARFDFLYLVEQRVPPFFPPPCRL